MSVCCYSCCCCCLPAAAQRLEVFHDKDLDICSMLRLSGKESGLPRGEHVLTIVPRATEKIIVAWLLSP